ncbi:MAG TPA: efflux RND transporter periplasmic adaptor subunit [Burkholderiales bacterium]|nr:efflux RND transporter periplasmic adaptor subunit [Burkholderiales bacterium]
MFKRMLIVITGLALVFGGIFGWKAYVGHVIAKQMANQEPPPVTVSSATAGKEIWQSELTAVASLAAVRGVNVSPEVAGMVVKINFESGQEFKSGQLLAQLDDAADRAELTKLKAQAELDNLNLKRQQDLVAKHFVSEANLDAALSQYKQDQAQVLNKEILIGKKAIKAPFSGRLGIRQINLGQYLAPGTVIVSLQAISPIYVNFSLPQQNLKDVRLDQTVQLAVNTYPNIRFEGNLSAIDPKVNEGTRNFALQATLQNEERLLHPGMFGEAKVVLPQNISVITLPQTALVHDPYGDSVYVIKEEGKDIQGQPKLKAARRFVIAGETRGDQIAIAKGINPGEQIVTAGQIKLKEGSSIRIDNSVLPSNNPSPTPDRDQ